jgi:hypothetical protein
MPRFIYWTIVLGDGPTAFRARERSDLVPTLTQLRRHHPEAVLKWFERGRLWSSPEEARARLEAERREYRAARGASWRPGGEHRDPRERYKKPREQRKREIIRKLRAKAASGESGRVGSAAKPRPSPRPNDRRPRRSADTRHRGPRTKS